MSIYPEIFESLKTFEIDHVNIHKSLEIVEYSSYERTPEQNKKYGESIKKIRRTSKAYAKYNANRPKSHADNLAKVLSSLAKRPIVQRIKELNGPTKKRKIKLAKGWYAKSEEELNQILLQLLRRQ